MGNYIPEFLKEKLQENKICIRSYFNRNGNIYVILGGTYEGSC